MNWLIVWNDGTRTRWPLAQWSAAQVLALVNVRFVTLEGGAS